MLNGFANNAAIRFDQSGKYLILELVKVLFVSVEVCICTDTVFLIFFLKVSLKLVTHDQKGKVWLT